MSIRAWLVRKKIRKTFRPKALKNAPIEERLKSILAGFRGSEALLPQPPKHIKAVPVSANFDGMPFKGEWVVDPSAHNNRIIFYTHGGAYVWGRPKEYRYLAWQLSRQCKARVFLLDYTLAPKAKCPTQINEGLAAYDYIRTNNPEAAIAMAGDSAGGSLTVAMAVTIRDSNRSTPVALSLIAPGVDLTGSGDSVRKNADKDVMLDPEAINFVIKDYIGDLPADDPRCSPLFASHENLPPMMAQVGSDEILLDDSVRLEQSVTASGGAFTLKIWQKMHHVWHMSANMVPEARAAIKEMATFMEDHWDIGVEENVKKGVAK
ncbi:alpha/beta hydrolase [Kordiimonas aquimaris]|uniref:alpha/beta hydrolase n=1 Tax=Kordiimonas aquimaris TaxID=707591 RepID=UPI0021D08730|nr:alpha/beta hydrolase [Kordiimonas aquimaris]